MPVYLDIHGAIANIAGCAAPCHGNEARGWESWVDIEVVSILICLDRRSFGCRKVWTFPRCAELIKESQKSMDFPAITLADTLPLSLCCSGVQQVVSSTLPLYASCAIPWMSAHTDPISVY